MLDFIFPCRSHSPALCCPGPHRAGDRIPEPRQGQQRREVPPAAEKPNPGGNCVPAADGSRAPAAGEEHSRSCALLSVLPALCQLRICCHLQVLNSCPASAACLRLQENTELMCLLQSHQPQALDVLPEVTTAALHNA